MNTTDSSISTKRVIAGNVLIFLGGFVLLFTAGVKLAQIPKVVDQFNAFGFDGSKLVMVAALELTCAVLFLIPATRSVGLLLVSSYLGGAIATHIQHGQSLLPPAIVLTLLWLGAWLRHPELLWSLNRIRLSHKTQLDSTYPKAALQR